ncbi:hypothetical protein HV824_04950 [Myxococcus sp. AM009]|uniref:hypothetical protein n=1 Tax=unclassified Myxococcus TaxID=2648731 RepID=UPI00159576D9|nr:MULTISPECIES: hypothetical protein [unclassified Myxococcus]NVI97469.1 hypothetical protein [Myxococcus sp. AM009]NVJ15097.1 hypothetical protein [Myxococcus sp. AM010]
MEIVRRGWGVASLPVDVLAVGPRHTSAFASDRTSPIAAYYKAKVRDARVFRLWGYHIPIIVDEEIKAALEVNGIVGGKFEEV